MFIFVSCHYGKSLSDQWHGVCVSLIDLVFQIIKTKLKSIVWLQYMWNSANTSSPRWDTASMRPWDGLDSNMNILSETYAILFYQNNGGSTVLGYFHSAIYDILLVTVIWEQLVILQYYCLQSIISYTTFACFCRVTFTNITTDEWRGVLKPEKSAVQN